MGMCLIQSSEHKEASVAGPQGAKWEMRTEGQWQGRQTMEGLVDHCRDFGFFSG